MLARHLVLFALGLFWVTASAHDPAQHSESGYHQAHRLDQPMGKRTWQGDRAHRAMGSRYRRGGFEHNGRRGRGFRQGCRSMSAWNIPHSDSRRLNPVQVSRESISRGRSTYFENCQNCHGNLGLGHGERAHTLSVLPANLRRSSRFFSDGELAFMIREGRPPMPAWKDQLHDREIWDLVNYIRFEIGGPRGPQRMTGYQNLPQGGHPMRQKPSVGRAFGAPRCRPAGE